MTVTGTRNRIMQATLALCGLLAVASGGGARADWFDDLSLRGSLSGGPVRWDGIYFGAQLGASTLNTNAVAGVGPLVAYILRNTTVEAEFAPSDWTTLPSTSGNSGSYGAFLGYNTQMDKLVLGFDLGYSRPSLLHTGVVDSITRIVHTSDGYDNTVTINAQSTARLVDYATLRGRAGYVVGQFLPYAVVGAAVGRFNVTRSAAVTVNSTDPLSVMPDINFSQTVADGKDNAFAVGFVAGAGMDVALLPNVFLRGEWEYIFFSPVSGITSNINTVRAGLGVRF
jgi:outer membrane immunogenic protein